MTIYSIHPRWFEGGKVYFYYTFAIIYVRESKYRLQESRDEWFTIIGSFANWLLKKRTGERNQLIVDCLRTTELTFDLSSLYGYLSHRSWIFHFFQVYELFRKALEAFIRFELTQ